MAIRRILGCGIAAMLSLGLGCPTREPQRAERAPIYGFERVAAYPHDPRAFTQGLQYYQGYLYESTGRRGQTSLRRVDLETGKVLQRQDLPPPYFGEGIAVVGSNIVMLTWQEQTAFYFDVDTLQWRGHVAYEGEGWGLAFDGSRLVMSDGSSRLRFRDPATFREIGVIDVHDGGVPVRWLNELAWIEGEIWANVFTTDRLVRIDPDSGAVTAWVDLSGLLAPHERTGHEDVLNGIAYDSETGRLFVTGKLWPLVFEIRVKERL